MKTTILQNAQNSSVIDTSANTLQMMYTPPTITSTTFTFLVSQDNIASALFHPLCDGSGNLYTVTLHAAGDAIPLDPGIFASARSVIIVAGSVETGSDKNIGLTLIPR